MHITTSTPLAAAAIAAATVPPVAGDPVAAVPPVAPKAAKPARVKAAKPPVAPVAAKPAETGDTAAERKAAADAVRGYYGGASLPFKAASDTFAAFRTDKPAKRATTRQAALLAAMLISGDNIKRDGTFKRGGFTFDGRAVQPETGCLSDMHGRVIQHVSGPLAGKLARDAIFRVNLTVARAEISANLGDKLAKLALARLDTLNPPKAKRAA